MKLAYPVATPEVSGRLLAWSGEIAALAPALRDLGYAGVELFVRDPHAFATAPFLATLEKHALAVCALGTGPVAVHDRLTFTDPDAAVRAAAVARTVAIVELAARCGAQVNVGKLRGNVAGRPDAPTWRDDAFRQVCAAADARGVTVTLEPQCTAVIDNLTTTADALAWLDRMNLPNLQLMLDTYHMHAEDPCPAASLVAARARLVHIHLSDTRRLAPGRGAIDFPTLLRVLRALDYRRFLTVEIEQQPDSAAVAGDAAGHLRTLLARL
jgi:sugar phosphate isomerase/epimerase